MIDQMNFDFNRNHNGDNRGVHSDKNLEAGRSRKENALANHEANREQLLLLARHILLSHVIQHGRVTADDVREEMKIPIGINPVFLGSVPGLLARARIIERDGFVESARRSAHARPVSIWKLINVDKARQWLVDHPLKDED